VISPLAASTRSFFHPIFWIFQTLLTCLVFRFSPYGFLIIVWSSFSGPGLWCPLRRIARWVGVLGENLSFFVVENVRPPILFFPPSAYTYAQSIDVVSPFFIYDSGGRDNSGFFFLFCRGFPPLLTATQRDLRLNELFVVLSPPLRPLGLSEYFHLI